MFGLDSSGKAIFQLLRERSALVVLGSVVRSDDHFANIAKVDVANSGQRRFSIVTPLGATKPGEEVLTDRFEHLWRNLGLSVRCGFLVLRFDNVAQSRNAIAKNDACEWTLHVREALEQRISVDTAWAKPFRLWPSRTIVATWAAFAAAATASSSVTISFTAWTAISATSSSTILTALAAWTTITAASFAIAAASSSVTASTTAIAITTASSSVTASTTAITVTTAALADQLRRDPADILAGSEDLEGLLLYSLGLWWENVRDEHPVDRKFCVDAHDVANTRALVQQGAIEVTFGLLCSGLSPGVGTIITFAC